MQFGRVANEHRANYMINKLKVVPKHLIDLVKEQGIKIYCFNEKCYLSYIGLADKETFKDGRTTDETSCFMPVEKAISVFDCDYFEEINELGFCTDLHEFGHALDYSLGAKLGSKYYLSWNNKDILKGWIHDKGLDWYANQNPHEYFATAFMAFYEKGLSTYKPWSYREHTREELFEKDNDMYRIIANL